MRALRPTIRPKEAHLKRECSTRWHLNKGTSFQHHARVTLFLQDGFTLKVSSLFPSFPMS